MISVAHAQSTAAVPPSMGLFGGGLSGLILPAVLFGVFYFLVIRPQNKRHKEHQALVDSIKVGDEVMTSGGILGKITRITDQYVALEINHTAEMLLQRSSISKVLPKGTIKLI
jgi:preprotein translocase subunit YajC